MEDIAHPEGIFQTEAHHNVFSLWFSWLKLKNKIPDFKIFNGI